MKKTIQDITINHINKIYSIIIGKDCVAGKINWSEKHDFVFAIFKIEECVVSDNYDTVEYGLEINEKLNVNHVWYWVAKNGTANDSQPLYNHHEITKYLIREGFDI